MSGLYVRSAVLASFLAAFSLLACSAEEAGRPDNKSAGKSTRVDGGGLLPRAPGEEMEPVAKMEGSVSVGRAVLNSAGDRDLVQARIAYQGSWVWPRCSLVEGPDLEVVRETIVSREPPRAQGYTRALWEESLWEERESPWADKSTMEKSLLDGGVVLWTFHEDPRPDGEAADPRRTAFFVRCVGGDPPEVAQDVAHVVGTPFKDSRRGS